MKTFAAFTAAAVLITTPISVCAASDYSDCTAQCGRDYGNRYGQCVERYGGSVEGEYCLLEVGQEEDGCKAGCNGLSETAFNATVRDRGFRTVKSQINLKI